MLFTATAFKVAVAGGLSLSFYSRILESAAVWTGRVCVTVFSQLLVGIVNN